MADVRPKPSVSRAEFDRLAAQSGLFDAADLLPDESDAASAARHLVEAGRLTPFQADALLSGRPGDLQMGNYEILDRLGAGGMGTVFKARHRRMKRVVAIKVLSVEAAGKKAFADRFQREVETIARLSHPNIVMAYDADECDAGPFLVMELVTGRDLASEVEADGPLPVAAAVDRIRQAARGLEYAHAQGIVHRDIKPGNLLRDTAGVVKVADLGLARLNDPAAAGAATSLTQAGTVFGTVDYMSPEQAVDSAAVDGRADVYSLGCTLHFLLTGKPPYPAGTIMAAMLKHRDAPVPSLRTERKDVPAQLDAVFQRMMAKLPADRYAGMIDLIRALDDLQPADGPAPAAGRPQPAAAPANSDRTTFFEPGGGGDDGGFTLSASPDTDPEGLPPSPAGLTVVLVEPSRTQAGIIRRYLQQVGAVAVHTTGSGTEALELARRERAGVIVSSMHLTDMTGAQLAHALLADPGCPHTGFVLATSESDAAHPGAVPASPRVVQMPKPFDPDRLARAIGSVTG